MYRFWSDLDLEIDSNRYENCFIEKNSTFIYLGGHSIYYLYRLLNVSISLNNVNVAKCILDHFDVPDDNMDLKERLCYLNLLLTE